MQLESASKMDHEMHPLYKDQLVGGRDVTNVFKDFSQLNVSKLDMVALDRNSQIFRSLEQRKSSQNSALNERKPLSHSSYMKPSTPPGNLAP